MLFLCSYISSCQCDIVSMPSRYFKINRVACELNRSQGGRSNRMCFHVFWLLIFQLQGLWIHRKHEAMKQFFGHIPEAVQHAQQHFYNTLNILLLRLREAQNAFRTTAFVRHQNGWCLWCKAGDYLLGHFSAVDILLVHCLSLRIYSSSYGLKSLPVLLGCNIQGLDWATVIGWLPSNAIDAEFKPVLDGYLQRCHQRDAYKRAVQQRKAKMWHDEAETSTKVAKNKRRPELLLDLDALPLFLPKKNFRTTLSWTAVDLKILELPQLRKPQLETERVICRTDYGEENIH